MRMRVSLSNIPHIYNIYFLYKSFSLSELGFWWGMSDYSQRTTVRLTMAQKLFIAAPEGKDSASPHRTVAVVGGLRTRDSSGKAYRRREHSGDVSIGCGSAAVKIVGSA